MTNYVYGYGHYFDEKQSVTIYEEDKVPIKTGLYDRYGNPLYKIPVKNQIGFIKSE